MPPLFKCDDIYNASNNNNKGYKQKEQQGPCSQTHNIQYIISIPSQMSKIAAI